RMSRLHPYIIRSLAVTDDCILHSFPTRRSSDLRKDDTIISTVRTYLRAIATINVDKKNLIGSTGFAVLTPTEKVNSTYLSFLLHTSTYIDQIVSRSTGVSYPAITSNELSNIECIMPDKLNQDKIAIFLMKKTSEIDALIADKHTSELQSRFDLVCRLLLE